MAQFSAVLRELRGWYQGFKWYPMLKTFEMHLLFGGLGIMLLREFLYLVLPMKSYQVLSILFYTIPLLSLAKLAFLLGAWLVLVSPNVKYLPYALWGYALYYLFPFTGISLSSLISPLVYSILGYLVFKYSVSSNRLGTE